MTDHLIERLRFESYVSKERDLELRQTSADRIENLEAALLAILAQLEGSSGVNDDGYDIESICRRTLEIESK